MISALATDARRTYTLVGRLGRMMRRDRSWIVLAFLVSACSSAGVRAGRIPSSASEPEKPVVHGARRQGIALAVLPFKNNTGEAKYADLGGTLADSSALALADIQGVIPIERQRIEELLFELKLQKADGIDQESAVKIGNLLGAQLMVFGSFAALNDIVIVTARVVSVESGEIIGVATERGGFADLDLLAKTGVKEATLAALGSERRVADFEGPSNPLGDFPKAEKMAPNAIGVVIGIRDYRNRDISQAEFALNDARLMKRYLTHSKGFQPENVIYLENPTKTELEAVLGSEKSPRGKLARYIGERDPKTVDLFVYYSGHGATGLDDRMAYFVPADANPDYIETTGYPRRLMFTNLAALGAGSITVVMETCFSGRYDGGTLVKKASPLSVVNEEGARPRNINLFASSAGDQISSWYPEQRQSLFTYYFAKIVKESDSPLKAGALSKRLALAVSEQAERKFNRKQTPQFFGNPDHIMAGR